MNIACTEVTEDRQAAIERRRELFLAALAAARLTQSGWAKAHGITPGHLSHTLKGRESTRLWEKIDAFIEKQLGAQRSMAS